MPVDCIIEEEVPRLRCDLPGAHVVTPLMEELIKRAPWTQFIILAQTTKYGEFVIGEAHVCLVGLDVLLCDGLELGSGDGGEEIMQNRDFELVPCVGDEELQVRF